MRCFVAFMLVYKNLFHSVGLYMNAYRHTRVKNIYDHPLIVLDPHLVPSCYHHTLKTYKT